MSKDAYSLLQEAMAEWQRNALSMNNAASLTKNNIAIPLTIKAPEYGFWQATNVYYDQTYGIVIEAKVEPYTSNE